MRFLLSICLGLSALSIAGCTTGHVYDTVFHKRTDADYTRQVELLSQIDESEIVGQPVTAHADLIALADATYSKDGTIVRYEFYRGGGGNDDGSDSTVSIGVLDGLIVDFSLGRGEHAESW